MKMTGASNHVDALITAFRPCFAPLLWSLACRPSPLGHAGLCAQRPGALRTHLEAAAAGYTRVSCSNRVACGPTRPVLSVWLMSHSASSHSVSQQHYTPVAVMTTTKVASHLKESWIVYSLDAQVVPCNTGCSCKLITTANPSSRCKAHLMACAVLCRAVLCCPVLSHAVMWPGIGSTAWVTRLVGVWQHLQHTCCATAPTGLSS